ncbi:MAG TPA: MFS transporter [Methylomirabilota bacterium]|nr:MFS transporter [Methylomirabilota bacterium]
MSNRWAVLALIMAAQTMANLGPLGIPAIAPLIRDDLGLTVAQAGSFLSAYYVGASLMSLPAGWLADHWGVLGTMVAGQVVIAVGLLASAGSPSFALLIPIMVVAGSGYGMLNPTTAKAAMSWFPRGQRATAVGLKQVGLPLGGALGALLMPLLGLALGWRAAVAISASAIALLALGTWLLYRDPPQSQLDQAVKASGALREVLGNRDLWLLSLATLIFAGVQTAFLSFLVLYLRDVVGVPLLEAGRYLVGAQVLGMVGRVAFGLLSDRAFGGRRRIVLILAALGSGICALLMAATAPDASPWWLAPLTFAFGFFGVGWNGVQHTLMAELVGPRAAGTAVGLGLAVSSAGVTLSGPLFGLAVERTGGYSAPWLGLAVAMAVAVGLLTGVREGRIARA